MSDHTHHHNQRLNEAMRDRTPEPPEYEDCPKCNGTLVIFTPWLCPYCGNDIPTGYDVIPFEKDSCFGTVVGRTCCGENQAERDYEHCRSCEDGAVAKRRYL
jgi:hypothetical protein